MLRREITVYEDEYIAGPRNGTPQSDSSTTTQDTAVQLPRPLLRLDANLIIEHFNNTGSYMYDDGSKNVALQTHRRQERSI